MTAIAIQVLPHGAGLPLPAYQSAGAAAFDIAAAADVILAPGAYAAVPTGLAFAVPDGFELQIRPRSGLASRHGVTVLNAPGTVDADYRGEVMVLLINHATAAFAVVRGMRIAQCVIAPVMRVSLNIVDTLPATVRGAHGFGSTGL